MATINDVLKIITACPAEAVLPRPLKGIYFLCRGTSVVYIGKSDNLAVRLANHPIPYESSFVVLTEDNSQMESLMIRLFKPPLNRTQKRESGKSWMRQHTPGVPLCLSVPECLCKRIRTQRRRRLKPPASMDSA